MQGELMDYELYSTCEVKIEELVINLIGLRQDLHLLPFPVLIEVLQKASKDISAIRQILLKGACDDE